MSERRGGASFVHVAFSGGRSSGYMLRRMLDAGERIDSVIFCNTGMESPETYEFLRAVNREWLGGELVILEHHGKRLMRRVSPDDMRTDAQPMIDLVEAGRMPFMRSRVCTQELKVRTALRYIYGFVDYKECEITSCVGLRADEPRRIARLRNQNEAYENRADSGKRPLKWSTLERAPLAEAGKCRDDVMDYYRDNPLHGLSFDPADGAIRLSNCEGCFMSTMSEQLRVCIERPETARKWDEVERTRYRVYRLNEPSHLRKAWAEKHLGREPVGHEVDCISVNANYTWSMLMELAERTRRESIPVVEQFGEMVAGGCGSEHCHTDI